MFKTINKKCLDMLLLHSTVTQSKLPLNLKRFPGAHSRISLSLKFCSSTVTEVKYKAS